MDRDKKLARNETVFRSVNENIEKTAVENRYGTEGPPSFVCECSRPDCGELIRLSITQYEDVRSRPERFFILPGHEMPGIENIVERYDGFVVIEKIGVGREVSEETDPRA